MKLLVFSFALLFTALYTKGQQFQDIQGRLITEKFNVDVIGSPFFNSDFEYGKVTLSDGSVLKAFC